MRELSACLRGSWLALCVAVAPAQSWDAQRVSNESAGCAYDIARGRTVVFGGIADTREFDGQRWITVNTAHSPSRRLGPLMTYDLARSRIVLVGGSNPVNYQILTDTWEYDGLDWHQVATAHSPLS